MLGSPARRLLTTGLVVPGRRDHHQGDGRLPDDRPPGRPGDRLHIQRDGLRRHDLRGDGGAGQAVSRHRPGRGRELREGQGHRRRRPGDDVRLRLQRDPRTDAAADRPGAPDHPPDHRAPAERLDPLAAARRQEPGDRRVRRRDARAGRHGGGLDPARPRRDARRDRRERSGRK